MVCALRGIQQVQKKVVCALRDVPLKRERKIQEPALRNSLVALKVHHLSRFCALAFKKPCENQHLKKKWYAPCEAFKRSKNKVVCALRGISKLKFISVHHSVEFFSTVCALRDVCKKICRAL